MADCMLDMYINFLQGEFDKINSRLSGIENEIKSQLDALKLSISIATPSPSEYMDQFQNELNNKINEIAPDLANDQCYQQVINILESCSFINENPLLRDPVRFMKNIAVGVVDNVFDEIRNITDLIPAIEINLACDIGGFLKQFLPSNLNILPDIKAMFSITDCMFYLDVDISGMIETATTLLNNMGYMVDSLGNIVFNFDDLFEGVVVELKEQIMNCYNMVNDAVEIVENTVSNGIEYVENKMREARETVHIINESIGI